MARSFAPIPAKPAFGTLKENLNQSDYLNRKKAKYSHCKTPSYGNSYDNINLYNLRLYTRNLESCNVVPVNKYNLIIGQYAKFNLDGICTVSKIPQSGPICNDVNNTNNNQCNCNNVSNSSNIIPTSSNNEEQSNSTDNKCNPYITIDPINECEPFYYNKVIDPLGEMFGTSQCGELNYTRYMVFYPPTYPLILNIS